MRVGGHGAGRFQAHEYTAQRTYQETLEATIEVLKSERAQMIEELLSLECQIAELREKYGLDRMEGTK